MAEREQVTLDFSDGTILLNGPDDILRSLEGAVYDSRVERYRAPAYRYAPLVLALTRTGQKIVDRAKGYAPLDLRLSGTLRPRSYQQNALNAWHGDAKGRGVVVLPTGSGKTILAALAMEKLNRPTLVVVPTIDLLRQWASQLERLFGVEVGMLGGGSKDTREVTVSTYDSAVLRMEFIGNQFGLVVFDECHHLPGPTNRLAATLCAAPYRLGLTATPERQDGGEETLFELIGPIAFRLEIDELEGKALAAYNVKTIPVALDPDEQEAYTASRKIYIDFTRQNRIDFRQPGGWGQFLQLTTRRADGRQAFEAYLTQKRIARQGRAKLRKTWELILAHRDERIIVFTADNDTAYDIGRLFFLPVITHRTKVTERKTFLDKFRNGDYPVLVTSKVLNEGVDVPEASVGIVISGSAAIREHVQRLGRFLRPREGKRATLYELISEGTSEVSVSERRGQHRAFYRKNNYSGPKRYGT